MENYTPNQEGFPDIKPQEPTPRTIKTKPLGEIDREIATSKEILGDWVDSLDPEIIRLRSESQQEINAMFKFLRLGGMQIAELKAITPGSLRAMEIKNELRDDCKRSVKEGIECKNFDPEHAHSLVTEYNAAFPTHANLEDVLVDLENGNISDEELIESMDRHHRNLDRIESGARIQVEAIKHKFSESVESAVSRGFLPRQAMENLARIRSFDIRVLDALADPLSGRLATSFDDGGMSIMSTMLDESNGTENFEKVVFHELVHMIAGEALRGKQVVEGDEKKMALVRIKSGLSIKDGITNSDSHHLNNYRNNYLNEAVTEYISRVLYNSTQGISNIPDNSAIESQRIYVDEQKRLYELFDKKLSSETIMEAYFENTSPEADSLGSQSPALEKLSAEMDLIEGKGSMARIDNQFKLQKINNELLLGINRDGYVFLSEYTPEKADNIVEQWNTIRGDHLKYLRLNVRVGESDNDIVSSSYVFIDFEDKQPLTIDTDIRQKRDRIEEALAKYRIANPGIKFGFNFDSR